jgi:hypothetical protein
MKKIMALFLLLLLCVWLAACAKADVKEQMYDQAIGSQEARPQVPIGTETETDNPLLEILSRLLQKLHGGIQNPHIFTFVRQFLLIVCQLLLQLWDFSD